MTSKANYIRGHTEALTAINQKYGSKWFKPADVKTILKESKESNRFLGTATRQHDVFDREFINRGSSAVEYKLKEHTRKTILKLNGTSKSVHRLSET